MEVEEGLTLRPFLVVLPSYQTPAPSLSANPEADPFSGLHENMGFIFGYLGNLQPSLLI